MRNLILAGIGLIAAGTLAGAAAAKEAQCEAKYYGHLVGMDVSETRTITTSDYRLVPADSTTAPAKPGRMTIRYDRASNRIVEVACG